MYKALTRAKVVFSIFVIGMGWIVPESFPKAIQTNSILSVNSPKWLTEIKLTRIVEKVEAFLEWNVRRTQLEWISDEKQFQERHGLGPLARAITFKKRNQIILGAKVGQKNFAGILAHELTHIILAQKYKKAIPEWLEEGLANFVASKIDRTRKADYRWLSQQKLPQAQSLRHPFKGATPEIPIRLHYATSTAAMEMIASKCDVNELLQLSVGKSLETYLRTFCEIKDFQTDLNRWVKRKSK